MFEKIPECIVAFDLHGTLALHGQAKTKANSTDPEIICGVDNLAWYRRLADHWRNQIVTEGTLKILVLTNGYSYVKMFTDAIFNELGLPYELWDLNSRFNWLSEHGLQPITMNKIDAIKRIKLEYPNVKRVILFDDDIKNVNVFTEHGFEGIHTPNGFNESLSDVLDDLLVFRKESPRPKKKIKRPSSSDEPELQQGGGGRGSESSFVLVAATVYLVSSLLF